MLQILLESGHTWLDVKQYSLSEVGFFVHQYMSNKEGAVNDEIMKLWLGNNLDKKGVEKLRKKNKFDINSKDNVHEIAKMFKGLK